MLHEQNILTCPSECHYNKEAEDRRNNVPKMTNPRTVMPNLPNKINMVNICGFYAFLTIIKAQIKL